MERSVRIAVVGEGGAGLQQRSCLAAVARAFASGATCRGMQAEFVLTVAAGSERQRVYEATGLPVRGFTWVVLDGEASDRALYYAGLTPLRPLGAGPAAGHAAHAVVDDDIRHLCDCDAWIFAQPRAPAALLPLRPFLVMADDDMHHTAGTLTDDQLRIVANNLTAAAGVLVWSEAMRREVVDFYGVEESRVRQVPRPRRCCGRTDHGADGDQGIVGALEQGSVWFVSEASAVSAMQEALSAGETGSVVLQECADTEDDTELATAYGEALAALL